MINKLNGGSAQTRLAALKSLMEKIEKGEIKRPETGNDVNNHIHTIYSFSPYSPTIFPIASVSGSFVSSSSS